MGPTWTLVPSFCLEGREDISSTHGRGPRAWTSEPKVRSSQRRYAVYSVAPVRFAMWPACGGIA